MARPVGEELARNPTAISRPKGGWFARIWTQRAGSAAGNLTVEKIHLERADPFTLWLAPRTESRIGACPDAEIPAIPSRAFTLWTKKDNSPKSSGGNPIKGVVEDQVIAPLPEGVFDEPVLSEGHHEELQTMQPSGDPAPIPLSCAFTIWTTPEALASPVILTVSAGQIQSPGDIRDNEAEQEPSTDGDIANLKLPLIRIDRGNAFTLWTSSRYISSGNLQGLSPVVANDSTSGKERQEVPDTAGVVAEKSPMSGVAPLGALAAMILLLIAAMFVIAAKDKQIGDLDLKAGVAKEKTNELKHDKQDLKALLGEEQEKGAGLAKALIGLNSDFTAAKEQYAKDSADLQTQGDQLVLNLKEVRAMLEESKKAFAQEQATRVQVERDQKALMIDLEKVTLRMAVMIKNLDDAKRTLAAFEQREDLMEKKMAQTGKALEESRAQMASGKMQLEQSEKHAAQLAAEMKKLKAQVDDLKAKPAQPPQSTKLPESKPEPPQDPVPEAEPKAVPKDKPDKGPINV
jgi:hypothetical protein